MNLTGIATTMEDGTTFHGTVDAARAEKIANSFINTLSVKSVKVIVTDDNGIKNELIYK